MTVAVTLIATFALAPAQPARAAPPAGEVLYRPPVDGEIVDPFRAPAHPFGPGNRGIDYATAPLSPAHAAADGEVIFAGEVAGALHVTIRHADGLRTSYSFLATIAVGRTQAVRQGDVVGLTGEVFHFGVRDPAGTYLDPALLFTEPRQARLVPGGDDGAGEPSAQSEPRTLVAVVTTRLAALQAAVDRRTPLGRGRISLTERLRLWADLASEMTAVPHLVRWAGSIEEWQRSQTTCTPAGEPTPRITGRRIVVEVGGLGSTSEQAAIAGLGTATLGYSPADVVRFSYRGGRVPASGATAAGAPGLGPLGALPSSTYDAADSQNDLHESADRLAELLAAVARAAPGVPVDVVAHSQGGLVARLALAQAQDRAALPAGVETLVTLGSPHGGADLATALLAAQLAGPPHSLEPVVRETLGLDPARPALAQLARTSSVVGDLARREVPPGVRFTSIAARGDLVVPSPRTQAPGAQHYVIGLDGVHAHDRLPGDPAATREVALAVAGRGPTCRSLASTIGDRAQGELIAWQESRLAVATAILGLATAPR